MKTATTREKIAQMVKTHPDLSAAEMGRQLGVTRERARQILAELGYSWRTEWKRLKAVTK